MNPSYIQFICTTILAIYLITLALSFATNVGGRTRFGPYLGADFGAFYIAGKIFNSGGPDRIYDADLHQQLYQREFPDAPSESSLPYVNAPFFVLPFTLLAELPYAWAYLLWILLSLGLYLAGFTLIKATLRNIPRYASLTALLLGLSFMPFLVECLAGGQTSAFGFFCFALAIRFERREHQILSGLVLALCSYKPTLLLLILPMLVISRRFLTLAGFCLGSVLLALVSVLVVGRQGCLGFINTLLYFTHASTAGLSGLRSWKYVDVNSFFRMLLGDHPYLRWIMTGAAFLFFLTLLFQLWWKAGRRRLENQTLVWAITLTWTLVLNLYMGIYDTTVVVLSVLLMTDVFYSRPDHDQLALSPVYKSILVLLYIVPWITQPFARLTGIQLYTLVLALLGSYQITQFGRLTGIVPRDLSGR